MLPEFLFQLYNIAILPAWLVLMIWPDKPWLKVMIQGVMVFLALSYLTFLVTSFVTAHQPPDFSSLSGLILALSGPWGMLTGWLHYLCFDLWVGFYLSGQARQHGFPNALRILVLFFVLMTGPFGWLIFHIIQSLRPPVSRQN